MLFAAGMGIGLVLWGAADPVSHFLQPPEGLQPGSHAAARAAMRYSFFHWGLHTCALSAQIRLVMDRLQYNSAGCRLVRDHMQPLSGTGHRRGQARTVTVMAQRVTASGRA